MFSWVTWCLDIPMLGPHSCKDIIVVEGEATKDDHHVINIVQGHASDVTRGILDQIPSSSHIKLPNIGVGHIRRQSINYIINIHGVPTQEVQRSGIYIIIDSSTDKGRYRGWELFCQGLGVVGLEFVARITIFIQLYLIT